MNDTDALIAALSAEATPRKKLGSPLRLGVYLLAGLALYASLVQCFLGMRPDFGLQFGRLAYVTEITLLLGLIVSATAAAILAMVPDAYQHSRWLRVPYVILGCLVGLILAQMILPPDARMVLLPPGATELQCTICIALVSVLPSAAMFMLLRRGASVRPMRLGSFVVLATTAVGCLEVRLEEANDSLMHLAVWHYLPILLLACFGAWLGSRLLKW